MSHQIIGATIPDHVPPELVWNHTLEDFCQQLDDPFLAASRLHDGPDIVWCPDVGHGRQGWIFTRQALQQEAFNDYHHFSSKDGSGMSLMLGVEMRPVPLDFDPPQQTAYRQVMNPLFTPRKVNELDGAVRAVCNKLIAEFEDRGSCEFIEEFAIPFPSYIFLSLVGLPLAEAPQFLAWEHSLLRGTDFAERRAAGLAVLDYLTAFLKEQKLKPQTELLQGLLDARIDGHPLSDTEIIGMLYTLYLGGLDTVYSTLGWIMRHLAGDQEMQRGLRTNLDKLPTAVVEFARAFSVVSTRRTVARDVTFHGVRMRAGDLALMPLYLAARDPRAHQSPHKVQPGRQTTPLTFAAGPHHCLGAHLARRELRIALESFLTRFDNIHIPAGESYRYHAGVVFGVDRLPLAWTRRQA